MITLTQQITGAIDDVVNINIKIIPGTTGTLSFTFDSLSEDLAADYSIIHTLTTENPTITLTNTDSDGEFISASIEGQIFSLLTVDTTEV